MRTLLFLSESRLQFIVIYVENVYFIFIGDYHNGICNLRVETHTTYAAITLTMSVPTRTAEQ